MEKPFDKMARRKHGPAGFQAFRSVRLLRKKGKGGQAGDASFYKQEMVVPRTTRQE
ncbi:MAG: hypothetical protein LBB52_02960 [Desulfovibrio sp.]|jgi:hypothetical protein|nr:hypothetical protein [Desulfovibrio sp.]